MNAIEGASYYCGILAEIQRYVESMTDKQVEFKDLPKAVRDMRELSYVEGRNAKNQEIKNRLGLE